MGSSQGLTLGKVGSWAGAIAAIVGVAGILIQLGRIAERFDGIQETADGLAADFSEHLVDADSMDKRLERTRIIACIANGGPIETCIE